MIALAPGGAFGFPAHCVDHIKIRFRRKASDVNLTSPGNTFFHSALTAFDMGLATGAGKTLSAWVPVAHSWPRQVFLHWKPTADFLRPVWARPSAPTSAAG